MTPEDLRAAIPVTDEVVYLNTGASGPSPRHVVDAVCGFQRAHEHDAPCGEGMYDAATRQFDATRETLAEFLGTAPEAIALTDSTGEGITVVAGAIDWSGDDTIVTTDVEHPAGTLPWQRLRDVHGVDVVTVEGDRGRFDPDDFADAVEDATLVCLSSVSWNYGTRLPVEAVTELAHDAGALVLVDAVQSIGQHPVDVEAWGADFVAGSCHKWPLGPWGSGVLYADPASFDRLTQTRIGSQGVEDSHVDPAEFKPGAARFELSTSSAAVRRGQQVAVETIADVGMDVVQDRVERLTDRLKAGIPDDRLLSPREYETGLVSWAHDDPEAFADACGDAGVMIRDVPEPGLVRASVHVFNTADDVDALLDLV